MRVLKTFEVIAAVLIIVGIVGALGKIAVDQVVYVTTHQVTFTAPVYPPTDAEKVRYLAELRQAGDANSLRAAKTVEAKMKAGY